MAEKNFERDVLNFSNKEKCLLQKGDSSSRKIAKMYYSPKITCVKKHLSDFFFFFANKKLEIINRIK